MIIDGHTPVETMRVGIRKNINDITDYSQFNHSAISFKSAGGFKIVDKKANKELTAASNELVTFTAAGGQMSVAAGAEIYSTGNRLYVVPSSENSLIQAMSYTRAQGNPLYRGVFEISLNADGATMKLVNEVTVEQYLYQVVPSEMPASFGLEALRAQAIAARTYALTDYYSNRFADRGFHIDDSTLSQVYNNSAENTTTTQAVNDTSGKIMKSGNDLVDARFYSTSGGYGASKHEVWADTDANQMFPGTPIPYLVARSYTYDPSDETKILAIDTSDEAQLNAFYKNLALKSYDSESLYFRWKVGLTKTELENTINANLKPRQAADPRAVLTKNEYGVFESKAIPAEGIGQFKNMYVTKRGAGGNAVELVIEGTTGTYKILKEYNIRFTIRPTKTYTLGNDVLAYRAKGGSSDYDPAGNLKNPSILYSAFFTFDIAKDGAGVPTGVTFYGGGNGHGVGMSQYGASMLGGKGWTYSQILNSYYANMRIVDMNETVLAGIAVSGPAELPKGGQAQTVATAVYSDGSAFVVTPEVTFSSSNTEVLQVSPAGAIQGLKAGVANVIAAYRGQTGTLTVRVTPIVESIELNGLSAVKAGQVQTAVVNAVYSDGSRVVVTAGITFDSSDKNVATVDANGKVTALASGSTEISAAYLNYTARYLLQVLEPDVVLTGIAISGPTSMAAGSESQVDVTATFSNNLTAKQMTGVAFTSSVSSVASVSSNGLVRALQSGSTVIQATYEGFTASYGLSVHVTQQPQPDPAPSATSPVTVPPVPVTVTALLEAGKNGKAVIDSAKEGKVSLPVNAGELLGTGVAEVKFAGVTLTIPAQVLTQLQKGMTQAGPNATIELEAKPLAEAAAAQLLTASGHHQNADITAAGDVYDFSLSVRDGDKSYRLEQFGAPVQVNFSVKDGANKMRTSVFYIAADGSLERIEGTWSADGKSLSADLNHFSPYAVLEINKSFDDMKSHWASTVVSDLAAKAVVQGITDRLFAPEQLVTRAEFSAMLARGLGLKATKSGPFGDVPLQAWYADAVAAAYEAGIVQGTSGTSFSPDEKLTREQMAVMLKRAWERLNGRSLPSGSGETFQDENEFSSWSKADVLSLKKAGLLQGREGNTFAPQALASRAEVAQVIHSLLNK
ncbi:SpoIID/LytB domain-containing protein [Paenibacillus sp. MBLB4367]|uniref:SpoIID/LytB domain-containing protein n=1 Tax=Paenibacillus sp. MBLB4367 TaxID=3384767 RepID=UPI0039082BB8